MSTSLDQYVDAKQALHRLVVDRIDALIAVYGSLRRMGKALSIDHAYLHRLRHGEKFSPSDKVLKKLGLTP